MSVNFVERPHAKGDEFIVPGIREHRIVLEAHFNIAFNNRASTTFPRWSQSDPGMPLATG